MLLTFRISVDNFCLFPSTHWRTLAMATLQKIDKEPEYCSRELSRSVRTFLEREVFPRLPIEPSLLPNSCQINPLFDLYRDQEANKMKVHHPDEWKCSYCSKVKDILRWHPLTFARKNDKALTSHNYALTSTSTEI